MQPINTSPRDLARKALGTARGLLRRLNDAYRARTAPAAAPTPGPAPASVAATPAAPPSTKTNWELRSQAEIVEHIEEHYHAGLRNDLPRLIHSARQLEREHGSHPAFPTGLTDVLETFAAELETHMLKEETMLFPVLRKGTRGGETDMPIRMMMREHEGHDEQLDRIHDMTDDLNAPADAAPAWAQLYDGILKVESELREHIYLENNVLFVRALGER